VTEGPDSESATLGPRKRLWRAALFLGGGVAGVVVGVALSAAFAGAADASPLPVTAPHAISGLAGIEGVPTSLLTPVTSGVGPLGATVTHAVSPVTSPVLVTAQAATEPLTTTASHLGVPIPGTSATTLPSPNTVPPSSARGLPSSTPRPRSANRPISPAGPNRPTSVALSGIPVRPMPAPSHPSQIPPLTANAATGYASQGQGGNPFGALLPTSILFPALVLGALLLAREKTPLLVFDLRYSPPG
jgi:hypothetical protein